MHTLRFGLWRSIVEYRICGCGFELIILVWGRICQDALSQVQDVNGPIVFFTYIQEYTRKSISKNTLRRTKTESTRFIGQNACFNMSQQNSIFKIKSMNQTNFISLPTSWLLRRAWRWHEHTTETGCHDISGNIATSVCFSACSIVIGNCLVKAGFARDFNLLICRRDMAGHLPGAKTASPLVSIFVTQGKPAVVGGYVLLQLRFPACL